MWQLYVKLNQLFDSSYISYVGVREGIDTFLAHYYCIFAQKTVTGPKVHIFSICRFEKL